MTEMKREQRMEVYVADVRPLEDEQLFSEKLALLPEERQQRIERYRNREDKLRGVAAGLLLEYGLENRGLSLLAGKSGKRPVRVELGQYGKPYIPQIRELSFNLSHAGDYAAAVFAPCAVGIDIERVKGAKLAVAKRFFTEAEYAFLTERAQGQDFIKMQNPKWQDRIFTGMWTRKESYIKAVGEGMHLPLTAFSVLEDKISGQDDYYLRTWEEPEGYVLSVCANIPVEAEVRRIDLVSGITAHPLPPALWAETSH